MSWNDWNNELFKSAKNGNLEQVKQCLENGADVNARNIYSDDGFTPLMYALQYTDSFEIVKYLVDNGADVLAEHKGYYFETESSILDMARNKSSEIKQYLETKAQEAKLVDCASREDTNGVREYLANGINANATHKGITALMSACQNGYYEVAIILITAGADINAKDIKGKSVSQYAAEGGNVKIMELLLAQGANSGAKK